MATIRGRKMDPEEDDNNTLDLSDLHLTDCDPDPYISCMNDTTFGFDTNTIVLSGLDYDSFKQNVNTDYDKGTIELTGANSDIIIDGTSLKQTLQSLNDRLAILQPNPKLEAEFDELHALAEQYRALEKKLLEKKKMWQALNND
jgi:hypothetical protein